MLPQASEAISAMYPDLASALLTRPYAKLLIFAVGDVVQLVRTLPSRWLESYTVTARLSFILNIIICFQA